MGIEDSDSNPTFGWQGSAAAAKLFELIKENGPVSRKALQEQTGLSKSGISLHVNLLLRMNLIRKVSGAKDSEAKRDISFSVNESAGCIVGVDLDRSTERVTVGLFDLTLNQVSEQRKEYAWYSVEPEEVMDEVIAMVRGQLTAKSIDDSKLWGIGVSVPVPVDARTSEIVFAPFLLSTANDTGIKRLERSFGCPVFVGNDANVMALAEKAKGEGRNHSDFVFLRAGWGVGAGIIIDRHLYAGHRGYAGEVGHSHYGSENRLCVCGNHDCVDTVAGTNAILSEALEIAGQDTTGHLARCLSSQGKITIKDIGLAAGSGDARATDLIRRTGEALGAAAADMVNVLNPELIIVGGPTTDLGEILIASLRQSLLRGALPQATSEIVIRRSKLFDSAGVIGAACLVEETVFATRNIASLIDRERGQP